VTGSTVDRNGVEVGFELVGSRYRSIEPPGTSNAQMRGISNSGILAGYYLATVNNYVNFLFNHGQYDSIPGLNIAPSGFVLGINPAGTALVGAYVNSGTYRGFVYQNKTMTTLTFPGEPGALGSGINDSGEVVGYFQDWLGNTHGFLWTPPAAEKK